MQESGVTKLPELLVVLRMDSTHRLDHLLAEFHRRRQRLGIAAEDVAEIDVEQLARFSQHQIIQMAIADAEQVRDDTIAGCVCKAATTTTTTRNHVINVSLLPGLKMTNETYLPQLRM